MIRIVALLLLFFPPAGQAADKIALLFLTVGELNHPDLWKEHLYVDSRFNIYIHSKHKMKDQYFAQFRIKKIVSTTWSKHVNAWQELIKEALKNPENKKFVLLSESCAPLWTLDKIYEELVKDHNSYLEFSRPFWSHDNAREVVELAPKHRWVGPEWVILNREHALLVAKDKWIISCVINHPSDAESYFPTLLSYHGLLFSPSVVRKKTTYANWKMHEGPHPYTFRTPTEFNLNLLRRARASGAFFVRKISSSYSADALREFMTENL